MDQIDHWCITAIEQNRQWLTAYVLAFTGDPSSCDDLVQQVFLTAYEKREKFTPGTNFGGWLRQIARNICMQHLQKHARRPVLDDEMVLERLEAAAAAAERRHLDSIWREQYRAWLDACLAKLTGGVHRMLEMKYVRGFASSRIAKETGRSVSAVDVALMRARNSLSECIERKAQQETN